MTEKIIGATIVPVLQSLIWTYQIGWMAKPFNHRIQVSDDTWKDVVYPVAANVTVEDCPAISGGLYNLNTDVNWKSLILIEAEGDASSSIAENIPQRRAINIEQDISIKVWLNDHQGTTHIAKAELMREFFRRTFKQIKVEWPSDVPQTAYDIFINKLRVTYSREIDGNPFSEYVFGADQGQHNFSYASFGMVFHLSGLVFPNCIPDYPELVHEGCDPPVNYIVDPARDVLSDASDLIIHS